MKVYLSAPISGVEDQNSFAFGFCQSILEYMGYEVVNPLNIEPLYIKGRESGKRTWQQTSKSS